MSADHPNITLMNRLDIGNLAACADLFADGFVWHYINPELPDIEGDYVGVEGLQTFFRTLGGKTAGTFRVEPVSATAVGDELVLVHVRDRLTLDGQIMVLDAAVLWRIVDGRFAEAWDIPAVNTTVSMEGSHDAQA